MKACDYVPRRSEGNDRDAVLTPVGVLPGGDDDEVGDVVWHLTPEPRQMPPVGVRRSRRWASPRW